MRAYDTELLHEGDTFNIMDGLATVGSYNGHIISLNVETEDGEIENRMLTRSEVALLMKEMDGRNHKIYMVEEED